MIRQAILSFTCACVAVLTHAQEFTLTELPTQKQLPVANIHSIMQDSEGFMWYATKGGGLCRDNGYHIDVFRSDRLTPGAIGNSNNILSIAEDKQKRIIFSSTDGLFVLDKHDYQIHRLDEQLRGKRVEVVKVTDDGTIWASSQNVIHHYDAELKRIGVYPSEWQGKGVNVTHFYEDSHSTLWAAQWDGGIIRYNKARDLFEPQPWIDGLTPGGIIEDKTTGSYWVSTWGKGIVKYWPEEARFEPQDCTIYPRSQASQVMYMRKDKSGRMLWTSTMEGLYGYEIREGQLARINLGGLLPEGTCIIDELTFDRQGNLWVPGFSPLTFILSPKDDGITRYGLETQKMRFGGRLIVWYAARENGWIWIEHDRLGLSIYDTRQDRMLFVSQTPDVDAAKFCKSSTRTGIWCFSGNRLSRLWFEDGKFKQESIVTTDSPIKCLYDDGHGRVYLGMADGIDCYDDHTKRLNHHLTEIQKVIGDYTAFAIDRQETLWAVDRKGNLFFHNPKDQRSGIDETGSNSNGDAIKDITIDTSGHLWLLSDQHLKEYNPKSGAYRIVHNQDKAIRLDYFCSITPDGDGVCVSGAGGILAIKPTADIDSRTSFVKPQITSVSIDGQPHIMGLGEEQIDIHPDAVNVELQFSTLNYLNADKVQYAYRLKGLDNEWHHLQPGNNKASFFGLGKGQYILEVKATDEYGRWSDNITSLRLYRKPAWYETWMADLAYALICLLIIGMAVRRYIIKQKRQQQQKMQEELTEMKFRFFTNISHELRTPLTLIVTPLQSLMKRLEQWHEEDEGNEKVARMQSQVSMVNDNANRLLTLVNRLLDFRKLEMGQQKLELASGDVHNFIRSVCETFRPMSQEKGIGLGYAIPNRSLTIYFDGNKLRHILTNLLSNAFKFTDEGGNIAVTVSTLEDRQLSISVKDNGCGIA
ncbi:MAG: triple tyrosine motif-containing protein, partial [Prevotella sp.]